MRYVVPFHRDLVGFAAFVAEALLVPTLRAVERTCRVSHRRGAAVATFSPFRHPRATAAAHDAGLIRAVPPKVNDLGYGAGQDYE